MLGGAAGAAGVGFVVRNGKCVCFGARHVTPRARSHRRGASRACCGVPKLDTRLDEREDRRKKKTEKIVEKKAKKIKVRKLPDGESNPGRLRDRQEY